MLETYKHLTNGLVNRVNAQRGVNNRLRDAVLPKATRKSFVQMAKLAAERQLAAGILAEASQRVPGNKFAITAVHTWFANIEENDLVVAALNENWQLTADKLPAQAEWHRAIYKNTPAQAVLLSQPVAGTAVANQPALLNKNSLPALAASVGGFASCPANATEIGAMAAQNQVLFVPTVGVLTWASTLQETIAFTETVNRMCEIILASTH